MAEYLGFNFADGTDEDDYITGTDGNDDLHGRLGNDFLIGGSGHDILRGGAGMDTLWGNNGNDWLNGHSGADDLRGGKGNDELNGGPDNDILSGDQGADMLSGGTGEDVFVFKAGTARSGIDTITDFEVGDHLRFGGYKKKDKLVFEQDGDDTLVYVDLSGNGSLDYLAVVVLNAAMSDVEMATGFGGILV